MSQKSRREKKAKAGPKPDPSATALALRKRRNRRLMVLGALALVIPILEVVAYRFRAITITIDNRTAEPITAFKLTYPGGELIADEIRPDASFTRVIRPDFTFRRDEFSTYRTSIEFRTPDARHREHRKIATLDYSCLETFAIQPGPEDGRIEVKQRTSPGFPLSAIRDLLARLGIG